MRSIWKETGSNSVKSAPSRNFDIFAVDFPNKFAKTPIFLKIYFQEKQAMGKEDGCAKCGCMHCDDRSKCTCTKECQTTPVSSFNMLKQDALI
jgi:hypothetical protein